MSRHSNFPQGPAAAAAGSGRTAAAAVARGQTGKGPHHDEQAPAARLSRAAGFVDVQLEEDMREGFAKLSFTRATARALYFAAFDVVHGRTREHDPDDFHRLSIALARLGDAGWPLEEE